RSPGAPWWSSGGYTQENPGDAFEDDDYDDGDDEEHGSTDKHESADNGNKQQQKSQSRYRKITIQELIERPEPDYLIDDYLYEHEISLLVAFQKIGKTFVAIDMAIAIATGTPFMGHDTTQGIVLIVAAEGVNNFRKRL